MPTVLRVGPYRFFFYAGDREEPPHIHVERDDKLAKFWLEPLRLQRSGGFNRMELGKIEMTVEGLVLVPVSPPWYYRPILKEVTLLTV